MREMYKMIMMPLWSRCEYGMGKDVSVCLFYSSFSQGPHLQTQMALSNDRSELYLCLTTTHVSVLF